MGDQLKNINFGVDTRQKFSIDGDTSKVIELDTTDVNIVVRYKQSLDKIKEVQKKYENLSKYSTDIEASLEEETLSEDTTATVSKFADDFASTESDMREIINYIFNSSICDTILGTSSIFSPTTNGKFKFEQILDVLSNLYEKSISSEMKKINKSHISKHTVKYGVKK